MSENNSRIYRLERDGWTKRFVAEKPRISEAIELYRSAGFEVHLEALTKGTAIETKAAKGEEMECIACFHDFEDQYKIIFTRPVEGDTEESDDLF